MVLLPLEHRPFDTPVRLDKLHPNRRLQMESMAKVFRHNNVQTKALCGHLLPEQCNDSHKPQFSKTNLVLITIGPTCLRLWVTQVLPHDHLFSRTNNKFLKLKLFGQHHQRYNRRLFSPVPHLQYKEPQPLWQMQCLRTADLL
jgi:hypothetical protein